MKITLLARENVPLAWPHVVALLNEALAQGNEEYGIEDLKGFLLEGEFQLWLGTSEGPKLEMVGVTRITNYLRKKRLRIELLAGKHLQDFYDRLPELEQWAAGFGATETEASVRPGLRKLLVRDLGFKAGYETVVRPIGT